MEGRPFMPKGVQQAALGCGWASPWGPGLPKQGNGGTVLVYGLQQGPGGGHEGDHPGGGVAKHGPQVAPGVYQCEQPAAQGVAG